MIGINGEEKEEAKYKKPKNRGDKGVNRRKNKLLTLTKIIK